MDGDLQKAYIIVKRKLGKRRYKVVESIYELKNKCIMIECDDYSSIVLYYNNKNGDNVEEIIDTFHFGNRTGFQHNDVYSSIDMSMYWSGEDEEGLQFLI